MKTLFDGAADVSPAGLPIGYREAKERHPGMLLLYRMGDFYELFDSDAEIAAKALGLTISTREDVPMAGFPHQALEGHLRKLLRAGQRLAILDCNK
jgi:DNA mismatch repair protein MutS